MPATGEAARAWFEAHFDAPTPVQARGWPLIAAGRHALLIAPTGSGKTLAAFFACLDRLGHLPEDAAPGVRVLYVSPLKALVYDIERNLRAPLVGIARAAEARGLPWRVPRVAVRTGDTPARERREQARRPAEILVTTPESLYLILGSQQRETLATVETVIVDEIHALAATKRGAHLALSLERVARLTGGGDPQRVGLSATARPLAEVARFLGGDREVEVVDTSMAPHLDLEICVPVPDMTQPDVPPLARSQPSSARFAPVALGDEPAADEDATEASPLLAEIERSPAPDLNAGLWPAIYPQLLAEIARHRSTLIFVNSRGLCERLAHRLNELAGEELALSHHGSIAHDRRRQIEEQLKSGALRALVATSSLELGIDMGAIECVLLVESPGAVSRGLQRVGRAGHRVGEVSRARIFPKHRGDLLEATVVAGAMRRGEVEPLQVPRNPLDVLAQQIVAVAAQEAISVDELAAWARRSAPFRELSRDALMAVLDMLAGRYPSTDFAELRPRLTWDREHDRIEARRGAGRLALLSGGTIPDRGLYAVHLGPGGPRIGELDEEMVHESRAGEVVTLGASSWRIAEITRDRVIVKPAPGEVGKLPFWRGEGPGRPVELGRALGAFVRELADRCRGADGQLHARRAEGERWLREREGLDEWAARNLVDYVVEQHQATGALPCDRLLLVERFRDELGDWRVCLLSPFGARIHAPWALAIEAQLAQRQGFEAQALWSDDGIVVRLADADEAPSLGDLLPDPDLLEDQLVEQLERSALFAAQFRENAARALLLPRRRPGARTPLWAQRLRAQNLLAVARGFPAFPVVLETFRSCLQDVFDVPGLQSILRDLAARRIGLHEVETRSASPFARSLVFAYTAAYLYQGDTPVAERRAQALALDRHLLRDLLGQAELRDLLDVSVVDQVEAELQHRVPERHARHPDAVHDLLRELGDLSPAELRARCSSDEGETDASLHAWLAQLQAERRAVPLKLAGEERWIAAEDAGLYRDALGAAPPAGLPDAFLEPVARPLEQLVLRFARRRAPFETAALARRYALVPGSLESVLAALEARGRLQHGELHPRGRGREWGDPEVLRRLRRRTLARLRGEVAPVEASAWARFLLQWHGVARPGAARAGGSPARRLEEVIDQLEGLPLPFSDLERSILPARVPGYDPRLLDELGALGQLVWVGCGSLGERDGRVALYRRERIAQLLELPERPSGWTPLHERLLAHLGERGASFFDELVRAAGPDAGRDEVLRALWDCVWAGLVTNDTLAPLRGLAAPTRSRGRRGRVGPRGGRPAPSPSAGRWSRVDSLLEGEDGAEADRAATATRRAHTRCLALLERYGVVSREAAAVEGVTGGFSSLYPVLRAMEEAGKLRRGHFVDGLQGAQFAFAGAVDRLRAARGDADAADEAVLLASVDPANPYGASLPWPETSSAGRPRRAAGCHVVLVGGLPVLFLERGGALQVRAGDAGESADRERVTRAASALRGLFAERSRASLRIDEIDGEVATRSPWAGALVRAGFRSDYKGLVLERSAATVAGAQA